MRTTFATVLFVASAHALTWTDVTDFIRNEVPGLLQTYLDVDITEFHMTTRADTRKIIENKPRTLKPLTHVQRERINEAHHSLMATR